MAREGSLWQRWWLAAAVAAVAAVSDADPQTNLLNDGCSQYNATNVPNFFGNLNASFSTLRRMLSDGERFATTQQGPVYTMVQCRNYLSTADCVACFRVASVQIRNCSTANGARVIYDGCFLRYESGNFFTQATLLGSGGECGNRSVSGAQAAEFSAAVVALLADLVVATPRINGSFAAIRRELGGAGAGAGSATVVYAVAQCAVSVGSTGCRECLELANRNFQDCPPRTEGRSFDVGCFLRYSDTPFFADNQTTDIRPFLGRGSSNKRRAIIGGVVGGVSFLLLIVAFFLWYQLSRKPRAAPRANILGATELRGPENFSYRDLKSATKNFIEENKLGEGGFGDVYKGTLKNGNIVAVKRLDIGSSRAKADFDTEVKLISNVHHRNLIRLLGCSSKGPFLLLVYEYMANGSLDRFLYGERRGTLNWKQRFDIIFGTARGLAYLHEQFHVRIIHRDIKPSNILLDTDFQPKIADFGLARLLPEGQSQLNTRFAGTLGYTAPEYAIHGQLSEKVDAYSFGVVVLEIISGKRSTEVKAEPVTEYLLEQAWKLHDKNMHMKLVDETLDPNEYKEEDVKKIVEIALMCTQSPASLRPTMSEVVVLLLSERATEFRGPNRPTLVDPDQSTPAGTSINTTGSSFSNATASFTEFTGR